MKDITFIHCADVHLDSPFSSLSDKPGLSSMRRRGLMEAFSRMIAAVRSEKPDLLIIAGDLFENEYAKVSTISNLNEMFGTIPDTKVLMITGNHDIEAANSYYRTYDWKPNVYFLGKERNNILFEDINTVIHGLGWEAGQSFGNRLDSISPTVGMINILLFHGDIDLQIGSRDYNSISSETVVSMGFDYIAAGHNHKKRIYNDIIYNPGSLDPLGFDEPGRHGYFKGVISKNSKPKVEFVANSNVEYITLELDITGMDNDAIIIETLKKDMKKDNSLYKVVLKGSKTLEYSPDPVFISESLQEHTLFTKVRDESSVRIPVEELALLKGLKGEFARNVMAEIEKADDEGKQILMKALYYGIEAIDKGSIEKAGGIEL
ncbi:MAG: DNA repair exonuclease [Clostridia bacterium]|nr:DNA repair exonuclease [Clostridia bacterium]